MESTVKRLKESLDLLDLPMLVTKEQIKKQYRFLAKKYHPDVGGSREKMEEISRAYRYLMKYIEEFRYTFDEQEIARQVGKEKTDEQS